MHDSLRGPFVDPAANIRIKVSNGKLPSNRKVYWILQRALDNVHPCYLRECDDGGASVDSLVFASDIAGDSGDYHSSATAYVRDEQSPANPYYYPGDHFRVVARLESQSSHDSLTSPLIALWKAMRINLIYAHTRIPTVALESLFKHMRAPFLGCSWLGTEYDTNSCLYVDCRRSDIRAHLEDVLDTLPLETSYPRAMAVGRLLFFSYKYPYDNDYPEFLCLASGVKPENWNPDWNAPDGSFPIGFASVERDQNMSFSLVFTDTIDQKVHAWGLGDTDAVKAVIMTAAHELGHQAFLLDDENGGCLIMSPLTQYSTMMDPKFCSHCVQQVRKEDSIWQFGGRK